VGTLVSCGWRSTRCATACGPPPHQEPPQRPAFKPPRSCQRTGSLRSSVLCASIRAAARGRFACSRARPALGGDKPPARSCAAGCRPPKCAPSARSTRSRSHAPRRQWATRSLVRCALALSR
jgi:hypothetical protein